MFHQCLVVQIHLWVLVPLLFLVFHQYLVALEDPGGQFDQFLQLGLKFLAHLFAPVVLGFQEILPDQVALSLPVVQGNQLLLILQVSQEFQIDLVGLKNQKVLTHHVLPVYQAVQVDHLHLYFQTPLSGQVVHADLEAHLGLLNHGVLEIQLIQVNHLVQIVLDYQHYQDYQVHLWNQDLLAGLMVQLILFLLVFHLDLYSQVFLQNK